MSNSVTLEAQLNSGAAIGLRGSDGEWWFKLVAGAESIAVMAWLGSLATEDGTALRVTLEAFTPPRYGTRDDAD